MFGLIIPGRPCITDSTTVSPNQFAFSFPAQPDFSHVVVFMLPGNFLPPNTAAAVYMKLPVQSEFKLLGAIGNEKPSALFNTSGSDSPMATVSLGISVEPTANIEAQLSTLPNDAPTSMELVRRPPSTKVLAQRIIQNAFNFLASFAGGAGGQEVVPLKSFEDWWKKFERRVENDPEFLEREVSG